MKFKFSINKNNGSRERIRGGVNHGSLRTLFESVVPFSQHKISKKLEIFTMIIPEHKHFQAGTPSVSKLLDLKLFWKGHTKKRFEKTNIAIFEVIQNF
jgi:hypothetical protein